ncbi:rod shape-determining protein MreC [Serpentinicella sp. ANB-PHB4]|uniref:rod shape-determining protein MreC n=1 Tax=Serpentinicella sp. ANB-PHB4 TaxID=3074076 RepID=UPI0028659078|nr:rod shape-determining protein MreC [Serpentinicella sp. ANB-PHB4]MDR5657888.1 rod shape-determining protein MreC [Serpentinicella sp. ANB-PHB4]
MKKNTKNRSLITVVIVAIILIGTIGYTAEQREEITMLENWVGGILTPIQSVISSGTSFVGNLANPIVNYSKVVRESERLNEEVSDLRDQLIKARLTRDELEELRSLKYALNYVEEEAKYNTKAVKIVGKSPSNWFDTFTIDAGKNHGLSVDNIVISSNGLVGTIYEVGDTWAKVVSIIDSSSAISFQILRNNDFKGVVSGSIDHELSGYLFDPSAEVIVGDKLITSELGKHPKGILIGEVTEVGYTADRLLRTIEVEPSVNFRRLNTVLVIIPNN